MLIVNGKQKSWVDRLLDRISPEHAPPAPPSPPPVDKPAWEQSVDSHKVNKLTVNDVGLILFQEMQSYSDNDSANDTLDGARQKIAHTIMNADNKYGAQRDAVARTALAVEPSAKALRDPRTRQAYDSSLAAAREAYLSGTDPTNGATHFQFLSHADRSNFYGYKIKTQSGPFNNSFPTKKLPSRGIYVDTYGPGWEGVDRDRISNFTHTAGYGSIGERRSAARSQTKNCVQDG